MAGRAAPLLKQVYHMSSQEKMTKTPTTRMASAQGFSTNQVSELGKHLRTNNKQGCMVPGISKSQQR